MVLWVSLLKLFQIFHLPSLYPTSKRTRGTVWQSVKSFSNIHLFTDLGVVVCLQGFSSPLLNHSLPTFGQKTKIAISQLNLSPVVEESSSCGQGGCGRASLSGTGSPCDSAPPGEAGAGLRLASVLSLCSSPRPPPSSLFQLPPCLY